MLIESDYPIRKLSKENKVYQTTFVGVMQPTFFPTAQLGYLVFNRIE